MYAINRKHKELTKIFLAVWKQKELTNIVLAVWKQA
jgi:hypothetical protein